MGMMEWMYNVWLTHFLVFRGHSLQKHWVIIWWGKHQPPQKALQTTSVGGDGGSFSWGSTLLRCHECVHKCEIVLPPFLPQRNGELLAWMTVHFRREVGLSEVIGHWLWAGAKPRKSINQVGDFWGLVINKLQAWLLFLDVSSGSTNLSGVLFPFLSMQLEKTILARWYYPLIGF